MHKRAVIALLCLIADVRIAAAQDQWPASPLLAPPPSTPLVGPQGARPSGSEQEQTGREGEPSRAPAPKSYAFKVDLAIAVAVPLTDDRDAARTGVGVSGAFGWDLGYLVPTVSIGSAWTPLSVPDEDGDDRTLTRFHMSVGLVLELDNRSFVVPVFGAMVDMNWWHVTGDTSVACGGYYYWGCYAFNRYDYTTGFTFKAGLDIRFPRNDRFSLGAGVLPSVTLSGGPFVDAEWWISPYAVFTFRI